MPVGWDAVEEYPQVLRADFPAIANYLYDVSDGQLQLDRVTIVADFEAGRCKCRPLLVVSCAALAIGLSEDCG